MARDFSLKELTSCFGLLTDHSSQNAASLGAWLTHKCILIVDHFCPNGFGMGDLSHACTTKFSIWQHMSLCSWVLIWSLVQVSGLARITNWSWPGCFHSTRNGVGVQDPGQLWILGYLALIPLQTEESLSFRAEEPRAQALWFYLLCLAMSHHVLQAASNSRCSCLSLKLTHRF